MQYPADGAGVLAPLCCKVQGPPVMCACCGRLSAFHTSADCAKSEDPGKSRRTARESSLKETENDRCFTANSLLCGICRDLPRLPERRQIFVPSLTSNDVTLPR